MKICPSCKSEFGGGEVFCPNDGARLVPASQWDGGADGDPMVGSVLSDRYRIIRQIGEGGMGLVYEAEHVAIEKRVALKVLRDDFSSRPEVVERFKQEAKSASRIGNDHIVDISDFGTTPSGASYFVMELLQGEDLANVLSREGHLPLARAADILLQCCKALGAAHDKGIVHRDMKPENIFVTEKDGRSDFVKLVDFGIAKMSDIETPGAPGRKLTKTGMIFGTPEYMSPEQAAGKPLDHRVDIYALAVILFEMITGRVPFIGDTFMGILTQHMFEDPPSLHEVNPHVDVPDSIIAFIHKGLAKSPDDRYQSCGEMAEALQDALAGRAVGAPTYMGYASALPRSHTASPRVLIPMPAAELEPPQTNRLGLVFAGAAAVLLAAAGGAVLWYFGLNGTEARAGHVAGDPAEDRISTGAPMHEVDANVATLTESDAARDAGAREETEEVDAGPRMVTVSVNTSPSGARVWVEGRGQVCDETPCSFETPADETIQVRARQGRSQAETEIEPSENTTIQLEMRRTRPASTRRGRGGGDDSTGRDGDGMAGDLKIPDFYRNPR